MEDTLTLSWEERLLLRRLLAAEVEDAEGFEEGERAAAAQSLLDKLK